MDAREKDAAAQVVKKVKYELWKVIDRMNRMFHAVIPLKDAEEVCQHLVKKLVKKSCVSQSCVSRFRALSLRSFTSIRSSGSGMSSIIKMTPPKSNQRSSVVKSTSSNSQQKKSGKPRNIPDDLRRKVLNLIRDHPKLSFSDLDEKIKKENGVILNTNTLFENAKRSLRRKLHTGILERKLKREEIEDYINEWEFGKDMEFHREGAGKDYEKSLWRQRHAIDVQEAIVENVDNDEDEPMDVEEVEEEDAPNDDAEYELLRSTLPCAIVISTQQHLNHEDRIKKIRQLTPEIPASCPEALRGHQLGSSPCSQSYPGIPTKKFGIKDIARYGTNATGDWPIQVAIEKKGFRGTWLVLFEGWNYFVEYTEEGIKEIGKDSLDIAKVRAHFLEKLADFGVDRQLVERHMFSDGQEDPTSLFWDYQDLTYFHTKVQSNHGLGPIFYMALVKEDERKRVQPKRGAKPEEKKLMPPTYQFTPTNIMHDSVYNICLGMPANLGFEALRGPRLLHPAPSPTACENPQGCVCNERFELLYAQHDTQNLQVDKDGLLDLTNFDSDKYRMVMECSDLCGCSSKCPRRLMQNNKTKATVVYYEGKKGNGLRAAANYKKGEYIGEYTGILKEKADGQDASYQVDMELMTDKLTICSLTHGNHIRFLSHSCEPSAAMMPTFSRRLETDPLIPRVALYALKDIGIGEEITISYYTKSKLAEMKKKKRGGTRCECGTQSCCERLDI